MRTVGDLMADSKLMGQWLITETSVTDVNGEIPVTRAFRSLDTIINRHWFVWTDDGLPVKVLREPAVRGELEEYRMEHGEGSIEMVNEPPFSVPDPVEDME